MRLRQVTRWIPVALMAVLLIGCGSATASTPSGSDIPLYGPSATTAPAQSPATGGSKTVVSASNFQFSPATITVKAGTTVEWQGKSGTHEVVNDAGSTVTFDGLLDTGAKFDFVFSAPGTYHYHCAIHPSMVATVIVTS
jgi:plastocyanin